MSVFEYQNNLRDLQLTENEMLKAIVDVCESNHFRYTLSSGTLLGAVRHSGFIPWDDDIDIDMPVSDYFKFLGIAQTALGDDYFVQTFLTDPNYHFAFARIRKNNTTYMNPYHQYHKIHHGVWVDIFPLVSVKPGWRLQVTQKWISLSNYIQIQDQVESHRREFETKLGPFGMFALKQFSKIPMKTRQKLHSAMLNLVFREDYSKSSHIANVWGNITTIYPKDVFLGEPSKVVFEGRTYYAPHDYDSYLRLTYGDYMVLPPESERRGHGETMILDLEHSYEQYMKQL